MSEYPDPETPKSPFLTILMFVVALILFVGFASLTAWVAHMMPHGR